jgi:predicted nucleic acid binding AN1-type Zn finger protein
VVDEATAAQLEDMATVGVVLAMRGGVKGRCGVEECKKRPVLVVGDCKYCSGHFCADHRLPEDHACTGMDKCKTRSFQANESKLMHEKCVGSRV